MNPSKFNSGSNFFIVTETDKPYYIKNPGPKDLSLPLPPGRGLNKALWSTGVVEKLDYFF